MKVPVTDCCDFTLGPDRKLACGCWIINGAICAVSENGMLDTAKLYARPGRFIPMYGINGIIDDQVKKENSE